MAGKRHESSVVLHLKIWDTTLLVAALETHRAAVVSNEQLRESERALTLSEIDLLIQSIKRAEEA